MGSIFTRGRLVIGIYVVVVVVYASSLPFGDTNKHYVALRHLGVNTRIHAALLTKPSALSIEDHYLLDQKRKQLEGKYLVREIKTGEAIKPDDVKPWPEISRENAIPVEFEPEPDWVSFNQGSLVQVWTDSNPVSERAYVLAIVPTGNRWLALLRRSDLSKLASSKEPFKLRLDVVAGK